MDIKDMPVVTVEQITRFRNAAIEAVEEIERLNALVAMQSEALNECRYGCQTHKAVRMADAALSATSETVSAWQSKRDNDIMAKVWDEASEVWNLCSCCWNSSQISAIEEISIECSKKASELRAKGE